MALLHVKISPPPTAEPLMRDRNNSNTWTNWFSLMWEKLSGIRSYQQLLTPASVAANTSAEQTFAVAGLTTSDNVIVNKPSLNAGIGIVNARVSADDTLAITYMNTTVGGIVPTSETYNITAIRRDNR